MKKTKIKTIIKYAILIFLLLFIFCNHNSYVMTKRVFDINIMRYKVIKVHNTLGYFTYSGGYTAELEVKEEQMESFCKVIERKFGRGKAKEEIEKEEGKKAGDVIVAENVTGRELDDEAVIYVRTGAGKRVILNPFASKPKSAMMSIVYCPIEEGKFRVWLDYCE